MNLVDGIKKVASVTTRLATNGLIDPFSDGGIISSINLDDYYDVVTKNDKTSNEYSSLTETASTGAIAAVKVICGIAKVREKINDGVTYTQAKVIEGTTYAIAKVAGIFSDSSNQKIMNDRENFKQEYRENIAKDNVEKVQDIAFKGTEVGRNINDASKLKYDSELANKIQDTTEKVGTTAAATIAALGSGGAAFGLGALYGAGGAAENTYQQTTNTNALQEGMIVGTGALTGLEWYANGKVGSSFLTNSVKSIGEVGLKETGAKLAKSIVSKDFIKESLKGSFKDVGNYVGSALMSANEIGDLVTGKTEINKDSLTSLGGNLAKNFAINVGEDFVRNSLGGFDSNIDYNKILVDKKIDRFNELKKTMQGDSFQKFLVADANSYTMYFDDPIRMQIQGYNPDECNEIASEFFKLKDELKVIDGIESKVDINYDPSDNFDVQLGYQFQYGDLSYSTKKKLERLSELSKKRDKLGNTPYTGSSWKEEEEFFKKIDKEIKNIDSDSYSILSELNVNESRFVAKYDEDLFNVFKNYVYKNSSKLSKDELKIKSNILLENMNKMGYDDYYNWKNIIGNDVGYTKEDNQKLVNCLMNYYANNYNKVIEPDLDFGLIDSFAKQNDIALSDNVADYVFIKITDGIGKKKYDLSYNDLMKLKSTFQKNGYNLHQNNLPKESAYILESSEMINSMKLKLVDFCGDRVSKEKIDEAGNVIFFSNDLGGAGISGCNNGKRTLVRYDACNSLNGVITHESLHHISNNSNIGHVSGLKFERKNTGINEATTEYFNRLILGNEYNPKYDATLYDEATDNINILVKNGVITLDELKDAYFGNKPSIIKNIVNDLSGDDTYYDRLINLFDDSISRDSKIRKKALYELRFKVGELVIKKKLGG